MTDPGERLRFGRMRHKTRLAVHGHQMDVDPALAHDVHVFDVTRASPPLHARQNSNVVLLQDGGVVGHHNGIVGGLVEYPQACQTARELHGTLICPAGAPDYESACADDRLREQVELLDKLVLWNLRHIPGVDVDESL